MTAVNVTAVCICYVDGGLLLLQPHTGAPNVWEIGCRLVFGAMGF